MKHCILDLWAEEQLPIKNGLYWADGRSLAMNIESYPHPRLKQGEWFDLSHFHECNPDEITYITMTKRIQLSNGGMAVWARGAMALRDLSLICSQVGSSPGSCIPRAPIHL